MKSANTSPHPPADQTGIMNFGYVNGVPFRVGQPFVILTDGRVITLNWK